MMKNKTIKYDNLEEKYKVDFQEYINEKEGLFIGDSLEALKKVKSKSIDLVITDPPYNISKKYADSVFNKTNIEEYKEFLRQ
jgi:site-specific DNA-methyltransferase (adenine-specific)